MECVKLNINNVPETKSCYDKSCTSFIANAFYYMFHYCRNSFSQKAITVISKTILITSVESLWVVRGLFYDILDPINLKIERYKSIIEQGDSFGSTTLIQNPLGIDIYEKNFFILNISPKVISLPETEVNYIICRELGKLRYLYHTISTDKKEIEQKAVLFAHTIGLSMNTIKRSKDFESLIYNENKCVKNKLSWSILN